jgi:haloalkane dehalogenase
MGSFPTNIAAFLQSSCFKRADTQRAQLAASIRSLASGEEAMTSETRFLERRIPCKQGTLYAQDYEGSGPTFVLMHGFPDNLHIYNDLVPFLAKSGRRIVAFDFLGFGASDRPDGAAYSFKQQLGDLEAVVEFLGLGKVVLVAHDSSGPAGMNFAIDHPEKVASLCILNSAYDASDFSVWPEMIVLFAEPNLRSLATAVAGSPAQFGWLLAWQAQKLAEPLPPDQKAHFAEFLAPLVADNFMKQPSSGPAFVQLVGQFYEELRRNSARLPSLGALDIPVKVIWGALDPYLGAALGEERASRFKNASFLPLPAGHWLQSDLPERVAQELLS